MIPRDRIKYRVGSSNAKGASFLVYIDARTAADELDSEYGKRHWQFSWKLVDGEDWAVRGVMKVNNGDEWIMRSDVGYPASSKMKSEGATEWLKDAVSDALKRCAVQFGVGRFLYDAPFLWTSELNMKDGRLVTYDPLTDTGKKIIEGNIDKWYAKISKE